MKAQVSRVVCPVCRSPVRIEGQLLAEVGDSGCCVIYDTPDDPGWRRINELAKKLAGSCVVTRDEQGRLLRDERGRWIKGRAGSHGEVIAA